VLSVVGFIKGKSAIHLARVYGEQKQNYSGKSRWARGYFVLTVGRDEATIRDYIRNQEQEDKGVDACHFRMTSRIEEIEPNRADRILARFVFA
jgi:putative transposase